MTYLRAPPLWLHACQALYTVWCLSLVACSAVCVPDLNLISTYSHPPSPLPPPTTTTTLRNLSPSRA